MVTWHRYILGSSLVKIYKKLWPVLKNLRTHKHTNRQTNILAKIENFVKWWTSGCVQLWEWMREQWSVWINEWRPKLIRVWMCELSGRERGTEGGKERASEFDVWAPKMTTPLPWASLHWLIQCTLECHWNATGWPSVHWNITGRPSEYLQGTLEHHWKNLVEAAPHWNATRETKLNPPHTGKPLEKL